MMWLTAVLLILGGTASFTWSKGMVVAANPISRVPQWFGQPRNRPGRIYAMRGLAGLLLIVGMVLLANQVDFVWVILALLAAMIPAIVVVALHNSRLKRATAG